MAGKRVGILNLAPEIREAVAQVHFEPTAFCSPITGRTIYVNLHENATAVLPSFTAEALAAAREDWDARLTESLAHVAVRNAQLPPHKRGARHVGGLTDDLIQLADGLLASADRVEFADGVRALLTRWLNPPRVYGKARVMGGAALRCMELVVLLWKHELIALPAGHIWRPMPFNMHTFPEVTERWYGCRASLMQQLLDGQRGEHTPPIARFILACGGLRESGDVGAEVFDALQRHTGPGLRPRRHLGRRAHRPGDSTPLVPRHQLYSVGDRFQALQRHDYERDPVAFAKVPQSYRENLYPKRHDRSDPEFKWVASAGTRLESWRVAVAQYVASRRGVVNVAAFINRGNLLLDYVVATADVPADPLDFCRRDFTPSRKPLQYFEDVLGSDISNYYVRASRETAKFFAWLLAARALDAERHVKPEYRNPVPDVDLPSERARNGQTYRNAIPLRFLRMLREIIEEDDFAWPKSLSGDYFRWRDPDTGTWSRVWSPVRAYFYLLRLALPLRGFQVRMLDSGEGDPECYRPGMGPDGGNWAPNTGRHAPAAGAKRPPQGFVRRVYDRDAAAWDTGLYVNTNKSGDRAAAWETMGYDIPWAPADVLAIFTNLRDFQERYNPAMRALKRSDLKQNAGLLRVAPDVAKRLVPTYFLFRDPCNRRHPQEPVTDSRSLRFWALLWAELERRLEANGMLAPDGRPYRFIRSRDESGVPHVVEYDGHSLRVSGLTHFLDAGVPIHILSAFVAGHASVIMTYHYIRPRRGQVRDALEAARARLTREDAEAADFAAFQRDVPLEMLLDLVVCNDDDAVARLKESGAGQAVWMQGGICPAGGGLCHEGGPVVRAAVGAVRAAYAPVLGGARNCPMCRFFVTGPAWIPALHARYNELVFRLHEEVAALRDAERRANDLAKSYSGGAFDAARWNDHRLRHAEDAVDRQDEQVGVTLQTLARVQLLIQRAEQIKAERRARPEGLRPNALVLGGQAADYEYALRATSAFQLVNGICESADLYPDIDTKLPAIRRGQLYDRMLQANGLPAVFATMSDRELKEAGDALARVMHAALGEDDTEAVMAGRLYLRDTGLTLDLTAILAAGAETRPVHVALPMAAPIAIAPRSDALLAGPAAPGTPT